MPTFYDSVDTSEGVAHILTKTRWLGVVPMPRTSVMPHRGTELGASARRSGGPQKMPRHFAHFTVACSS